MALKVPPLGGGFLTGTIDVLGADDFCNNNPRYQGENLATNKQRFEPLIKLAEEHDITAAQLSLAWLLHQGEDIIPIPATLKGSNSGYAKTLCCASDKLVIVNCPIDAAIYFN